MKNPLYNSDVTCKAMQNAALKSLLNELKNVESYTRPILLPIADSIVTVLKAYNCLPCKCLESRATSIRVAVFNSSINVSDIKAFAAELETFINFDKNKE